MRLTSGGRKDLLLGPPDTQESHEEYARVLRTLAAKGGRHPDGPPAAPPAGLSVNEVVLAWWTQAEAQRGAGNKELQQYRYALRP